MRPETGTSASGLTFKKESRILKRRQFLALSQREPRAELLITAGSFLVIGRPNGLNRNRLGATVTKKVALRAVVRNRIKRQVREFFRLNQRDWPQGLDLLFIARQGAAQAGRAQLRDDLRRAGRKISARAEAVPGRPEPAGPGSGRPKPPEAGPAAPAERPSPAPERPRPEHFGALEIFRFMQQGPGRLALGFIRFYQRFISPLTPPACRFWPTCSNYAAQAIRIHGFWRGSRLTAWRLLKCHPLHPGGYDPVPPAKAAREQGGPA